MVTFCCESGGRAVEIVVAMVTPLGNPRSALLLGTVLPATAKRYESALREFLSYCRLHGLVLDTPAAVDSAAFDFCTDLYFTTTQHRRKQVSVNLLSGLLLYFPDIKGHLPLLARAVKAWQRVKPAKSWQPLPVATVMLVICTLVRNGKHDVAAALALCFSSLMRPGEVLAARRRDVALRGDPRLASLDEKYSGTVFIGSAKTGANQLAFIQHDWAAFMLYVHLSTVKGQPGDKLFSFSSQHLLDELRAALSALGVAPLVGRRIVVHSFRHSGAADMLMRGEPMADVMKIGRWRQSKSAETYLQLGAALIAAAELPVALSALAAAALSNPWGALASASNVWRQACLGQRAAGRR